MIKGLPFFVNKIKTITHTTIPITAAVLAIIIVLTGTTITTGVVSVWAGTFPGPNGQIAFVRGSLDEPEFSEIYVMNADGSDVTRLTDNDAFDGEPSWSPDGEKIAFQREFDEIYVMNADGSEQTRLTDNDAEDLDPSWSPDGEKIAFTSDRDGNYEIYVMNADDGSDQTRLTDNDASDEDPSWSPDGEKIAFESIRDDIAFETGEIYIMNADDGSDQTRLTDNSATDQDPDWGTAAATTPAQLIDELISAIQNLDDNVPQSVKTSLTAALKEVSNILSDDNPNNDESAACGTLGAFINQVDANERRDTLTADQADDLRTRAEDIRDELDC